jgi:exodeoxyribonuclease VII small subunit
MGSTSRRPLFRLDFSLPSDGAPALRQILPIGLAVQARANLLMLETTEAPASFEAALSELEEIVATMETGQLPLQQSLAAYKRGAMLLQYCQTALKDAQLQVEVLERGVLKVFEPISAESTPADDES